MSFRIILLAGLAGVAAAMTAAAAEPSVPARVETLPAGTHVRIRLGQSLDTRRDKPGTPFVAHLSTPLVRDGAVIAPRGAVCRGHVVDSSPSGRLKGRAMLRLGLDTIEVRGRRYAIETTDPALFSKPHMRENLELIGGGAGTGATVGAIAGGGVGALVGAGVGAAAGTTGAVITGKRNLHLAPETPLVFALRNPVSVLR